MIAFRPPLRARRGSRTGEPLVTVGITTHNEGQRITRCLESVAAQSLDAGQIEVIVVDDGSTDGTRGTAGKFADAAQWAGFRILRHRNTGSPNKGRNRIIDEARGEFIFLIDGDDYLGPQALEATAAAAQRRSADVVVGRYQGVGRAAPNIRPPADPADSGRYHSGWLHSLHIQKLFRTQFVRQLDYRFNESLIYCSDHPFMISAFLHAKKVVTVDDVDCYFITLETTDHRHRGHVSRAEISAAEQLKFLHDVFGILALARGQGGKTAALAGRMRVHYWNRLLKNQIPALILRKDSADPVVALAKQARYMAELYGATASQAGLVEQAGTMLEGLHSDDAQAIIDTAAAVRQSARDQAAQNRSLTESQS